MNIPPWTIVSGLGTLSRSEMCLLLPHFEETSLGNIAIDKLRDASNKLDAKGESAPAFSERLRLAAERTMASPLPDAALRARLWDHLLEVFAIDAGLPLSSRVANSKAAELAHAAAATLADQFRQEEEDTKRTPVATVWRGLTSLFDRQAVDFSSIVVAQAQLVAEAVATAAKNGELSDADKAELIRQVQAQIAQVPPELRDQAMEQALKSGDAALLTLFASGSSLVGVGVAVKLAGFGAYIFAAQAAAFIPFVGGSTTVSMLFVLANPLFIGPAILAGAFLAGRHVKGSHTRQLAANIAVQLCLKGVSEGRAGLRVALDDFRQIRPHDLYDIPFKRQAPMVHKLSYVRERLGTPLPAAPWEPEGVLARPLNDANGSLFNRILFSKTGGKVDEALIVGGLTIGDVFYHAVAISPEVLSAVDFSHTEEISDIFSFGVFADNFTARIGSSLTGGESRLRGYVAEQIVAARLFEKGHVVSLPDTSNNPGFDVMVDGQEFQVKCLADLSGLREHFAKYPETPVFANGELAEAISASAESWASKVFFVEGFDRETTDFIMHAAIDAGASLGDNNVPYFAVAVSTAKHLIGWWRRDTPLSDLPFAIVLDGAVKGGLSAAGGFSGGVLGLLLFGPAGALVFTGIGGVSALTGAQWTREQITGVLSQEWSKTMDVASQQLRGALVRAVEMKLGLLRDKQCQIDGQEHQYQSWLSARAADDLCGLAEHLYDLENGQAPSAPSERARHYLKIMTEASVHPAVVQSELTAVLQSMRERPSLTESSSKAVNDLWSAIKGRLTRSF